MKILLWIVGIIVVLVAGFFALNAYIYEEKQAYAAADYKDAEYFIEGERIRLQDGVAETEVAPGSAEKAITRYFGNEVMTDLDGDGQEDVAFILTRQAGGSGTFYYAVAARSTERGYVGSDGYLLGDRIAPQSIDISPNPRHVNVIVVNYADRAEGEPMTAQPSVGKSVYLKLDQTTMQWGIVEPDFEGEAENLPPAGGSVTVRGEIACLPKSGTGPQTMECAIGLKGEDGNHYALRDLFDKDPSYSFSQTGTKVEVSGTISYEEQRGPDGNPYDIIGVLTVDTIIGR